MKVIPVSVLAVSLILFSQNLKAQTGKDKHPVTDPEKIADAMSAGPEFITKNATMLNWPATPRGKYRVLRKGTSEWSCRHAIPGYLHDEPGCFDEVYGVDEGWSRGIPHINAIAISYMYKGAFVRKPGETGLSKPEFHVGPRIKIN